MKSSVAKLLSEIMLLHRWAGGEFVPLDNIYGLAHGVESVMKEQTPRTISEETQAKIEDILEEVEAGHQSEHGMSIKARLREDKITWEDAQVIMRLCMLQSKFIDGIEKIVNCQGSAFPNLLDSPTNNNNWFGALHYVELIDESGNTPMMAVFTPCVPRIGEIIEGHKGQSMEVVDVRYLLTPVKDPLGGRGQQRILYPHVYLQAVEEDETADEPDGE